MVKSEEQAPPTTRRSTLRIPHSAFLALIVLGGLLLRLVFFWASLPSGGAPFIRDEGNYLGIAVPLWQGQGFVEKWVWLRPPGYPALIASFLAVSNGSIPFAALGQILLSTLNIVVVYALTVDALRLRGDLPAGRARAAGLAAAGLMAVNPHVVLYANLLMVETPYMLALSVAAWLMVRAVHTWDPSPVARIHRQVLVFVVLAALAMAAAALMRSLALSFTPLLLAWFWWVLPRYGSRSGSPLARRLSARSLVPLALFVVVMFAAIVPWTARNYVHYHRFLLIDTVSGYNLWLYNNDVGDEEVDRRLLEIANPAERAQFASQQGTAYILADLPRFAGLALERFADAWPVDHFYEFRAFFRDKYPGTDCTNLDVFAWLGTGFYVALGLFAIWGIFLAPGRAFKGLTLLVLLHYGLSTMIAHAEFRYRLPLYPFLGVYAGWALASMVRRLRFNIGRDTGPTQNPKSKIQNRLPKAGAALASLVFLVACYPFAMPGLADSVRFERRYLAGKSAMDRGDYAAALANFTGAAEVDRACSALYRNIGLAEGKLGQPDKERAAYTTAISREEHDWRTRALLSDRLRAAGDPRAQNPVKFTRGEFQVEQQRWAWENLAPPKEPVVDVGGPDIGYVLDFQASESEKSAAGDIITYRWTTDHSAVRLVAPDGSGPLRLVVRLHSLAWPGKPSPEAQVRVLVNNQEAGTLTAHPGWDEASLDVPNLPGGQLATVDFFVPAEKPPGAETRLLGVAVDSVTLERK
jgi:tetratricopeptide (TPR) repeat protein